MARAVAAGLVLAMALINMGFSSAASRSRTMMTEQQGMRTQFSKSGEQGKWVFMAGEAGGVGYVGGDRGRIMTGEQGKQGTAIVADGAARDVGLDVNKERMMMEEQGKQKQGKWVLLATGEAGDVGLHSNKGSGRMMEEQGRWILLVAAREEDAGNVGFDSRSRGSRSNDSLYLKKQGQTWAFIALGVVGVVAVVGIMMMIFPAVLVCVVRMLGFTAQGIAAGSNAAFIMSLYAGRVAVGSFCAICQSIGALGVAGVTAICACGPLVLVSAAVSILIVCLVSYLCAHHDFSHLWHNMIDHITELWNNMIDHIRSI